MVYGVYVCTGTQRPASYHLPYQSLKMWSLTDLAATVFKLSWLTLHRAGIQTGSYRCTAALLSSEPSSQLQRYCQVVSDPARLTLTKKAISSSMRTKFQNLNHDSPRLRHVCQARGDSRSWLTNWKRSTNRFDPDNRRQWRVWWIWISYLSTFPRSHHGLSIEWCRNKYIHLHQRSV